MVIAGKTRARYFIFGIFFPDRSLFIILPSNVKSIYSYCGVFPKIAICHCGEDEI